MSNKDFLLGMALGSRSGGGALMVNVTADGSGEIYTMDKTAQEIIVAFEAGKNVIVEFPANQYYSEVYSPVLSIRGSFDGESTPQVYTVYVQIGGNVEQFQAVPETDWYPELSFE